MNDALLVRVLQTIRHLSGHGQGFLDRNRSLREAVSQPRPFDQLDDR